MAIMTRMLRLCKADAHGVMDQLEDKGLLLRQYLREMEASLAHKDQTLMHLTQRIERLAEQTARCSREMEKLEPDLDLALAKEKDDIARMLIRKRRTMDIAAARMEEQVAAMTREKARLSETLAGQRLQYETLKAKADAHCRRAGEHLFDEAAHPEGGRWVSPEPSEEEIELELLRRKESLGKGGAS